LSKDQIGEKIFVLPVALSAISGQLDFYVTDPWLESSSLLKPTEKLMTMIKSDIKVISVNSFRLSDFFTLLPDVPYIEYIKIDAQGKDLEIVKSGCAFIKEKVVYITLEADCHYYEKTDYNSSIDEITAMTEYMSSLGFYRILHPNTIDPTFLNSKYENLKDLVYICQK
jgi:hypothetical protein